MTKSSSLNAMKQMTHVSYSDLRFEPLSKSGLYYVSFISIVDMKVYLSDLGVSNPWDASFSSILKDERVYINSSYFICLNLFIIY